MSASAPLVTRAGPSADRTRRRLPRRSTLAVAASVLVALIAVVLLTQVRTQDELDPSNPGPDGAQAVARVLADQGVDVIAVRSRAELEATGLDADSTLVVVSPERLASGAVGELLDLARGARVIVAGAGPAVSQVVGPALDPVQVVDQGPVEADCDGAPLGPLLSGLALEVDTADAYDAPGCFEGRDGALLVDVDGLTLLGAERLLSNTEVLRADNAAVALRLLGQRPRLVWYVPSLADVGDGAGVALRTLLPPWLLPGLWLLALSVIATALWRGRRLGALASEPLPVVVRSTETTDALGRLYRSSGDRAHAAAVLRTAARRRAVRRLRLARSTDPADVVSAVARHTGRSGAETAALLLPDAPPPATDHDLITLACDLADLDREARRP